MSEPAFLSERAVVSEPALVRISPDDAWSPGSAPLRRVRGGTRSDLGASSIEYVGAMMIAAALVIGVLATLLVSQPDLRDAAKRAVCAIVTLGQGDCGGSDQAIDRKPQEPCVVSSDGGEVTVSAGVILFGEGGEVWLIEELGDGRYRVIEGVAVAGGAEGGAGGKIEVTINDQSWGGEAGISGSAKIGIKAGKTYYTDSLDDAKDLLGRMRYETGVPDWARSSLHFLHLGPDNLPAPDSQWIEAGVGLEGEGSLEGGPASASATASLEGAIGTELNKDGSATVYLKGTLSGEASVSVGQALLDDGKKGKHAGKDEGLDFDKAEVSAGADGTIGATVKVSYDAEGNATGVQLTSTMGWSAEVTAKLFGIDLAPDLSAGSTTDTTVELPLTSATDKQTAAAALAALGLPYVPGVSDGVQAPNPLTAADALAAFTHAAFDHGRVWKDTYTADESTKFGLKVEAALEGKINIGGSYVTNERSSIDSRYWDGNAWIERPECAGAA